MSSYVSEMLLTHLRDLTSQLGTDGGLIGPSVYDTAQVLRKAPPPEGVWDALEWLISQQQPDGGWGDPAFPLARDVPTLAAILAIHQYSTRTQERKAINTGIQFLWRHASQHWGHHLPDALPVAIEILIPRLLNEALEQGLDVPQVPYEALCKAGEKRLRLIASIKVKKSTTPVHAWEAWGFEPDPELIDGSGGIGHSPAATAAWLQSAKNRPELADQCAATKRYLSQASKATGVGIPGVVPTVWPITRFEHANALYALLLGGLFSHPRLKDMIEEKVELLEQAMTPEGIGMSDFFIPDGDDTAVALTVLKAAGRDPSLALLERFSHNSHFCAYHGELQPSLSVTAHAVHTLRTMGRTEHIAEEYIAERQRPDGSWLSDKWNNSWLYTTGHTIIALSEGQHNEMIAKASHSLQIMQYDNGGWGTTKANPEETAYGIIALRALLKHPGNHTAIHDALQRAESWMLNNYRPFHNNTWPCWLGKETYRPHRLAQMFELVATFPSHELIDG